MSEQEIPSVDADTPIFQVQKLYVKDVSFENPNAPQIFIESKNQLNIEMNLGLNNQKIDNENWEVALKASVIAHDKVSEKLVFEVEVEYAGVFLIRNIPGEHINGLLGVDCPTILFPYMRQIVSQLTVDGGFMPFLMEPINFRVAYENNLQQQAKEAEQAPQPTIQ